jgi:hypothetical protein
MTQASMPRDGNSKPMQLTPSIPAIATTYNASISVQVEVTLNALTSFVEISAINTPIFLKYKTAAGGTAVSTSAFDEFIGAGLTRHYKVPVINGVRYGVFAFIEQSASATLVLIEKS